MPCRIASDRSRVTTRPVARDDPGVVRGALGDEAVLDQPGVVLARLLRHHLAHRGREQLHRLDVAPRPADVRARAITRIPSRAAGVSTSGRAWVKSDEARHRVRRIGEVAVRRAARHLEVDHPLGRARSGRRARGGSPRSRRRVAGAGISSSSSERWSRREVAGEVDELALEHARHLVDPVGEEEAAVEDADLRLLLRHVGAVHVDDAAHLTPRARGADGCTPRSS